MKNKQIGISDFLVTSEDSLLRTSGLGSCVGLIVYDTEKKIGGMSHIMLPESPSNKEKIDVKKYCDTNIPLFYELFIKAGAVKSRLKAALFGGAEMFPYRNNPLMNIGRRNIETTLSMMDELNIPVVIKETGGSKGRTIEFNTLTGEIKLKTAYQEDAYFQL